MTNPDLVAGKYAVASAVFYWDTNGLNERADTDDAKGVTKRINGGLNGFPERLRLIKKAKKLLQASPEAPTAPPPAPGPAPTLEDATHRVAATSLNLRRTPQVKLKNRIGTLGQGKGVVKVREADTPGWAMVRVMLHGKLREGFVYAEHLEAIAEKQEVAKRADLARSGHIVAVLPEHGGFKAKRNSAGEVLQPVESQAGVSNFRFEVQGSHWWQKAKFQSYGFWRHG